MAGIISFYLSQLFENTNILLNGEDRKSEQKIKHEKINIFSNQNTL